MQGMTHQQFMQKYGMLQYEERIAHCHTFYCASCDKEQLEQLLPVLREMEEKESVLAKIRIAAKALLCCIKAKVLLLSYCESDYAKEAYETLFAFLEEALISLADSSAVVTVRRLTVLKQAVVAFEDIMQDAVELVLLVRDENGVRSTSSVELMEQVLDKFLAKKQIADELPGVAAIFEEPAFKMDDPFAFVRGEIDEFVEWSKGELADMKTVSTEAFFAAHVSELQEIEDAGELKLSPSLYLCNEGEARTVVLSSPFLDEVTLFARAYSQKFGNSFLALDAAGFADCRPEFIGAVFSTLAAKGKDCLITGLCNYRSDNVFSLYEAIVRYTVAGHIALLHDTKGDRALYDAIYGYIKDQPGFSVMQVSYRFLRLPSFREFCEELEERGIVKETEYAELRENYAFAGYVGLNRIIYYAAAGRPWGDRIRELSLKHERLAQEYLRNVPTQEQLLDSAWRSLGLVRDGQKPKREFDYDTVRSANPANIKKILEADIDFFAKCGLIVKYCTLHGDDLSVWETLDAEELSIRMTEATQLISYLLQNQYSPIVEVVPDEEWTVKRAGGLCCDGGKLIKYKAAACRDYAWAIDAVCHECYHGFQHTLVSNGHLLWHWEELGVTENRVKEWHYNFDHYRDITAVVINYMVQVVEADARTFAADCMDKSARIYNAIDLE